MYAEVPFALNWIFNENQLSDDDGIGLKSPEFIISSEEPEIKCTLILNGVNQEKKLKAFLEFGENFHNFSSLKLPFSIAIENNKQSENVFKKKNGLYANITFYLGPTLKARKNISATSNNKIDIKFSGVIYLGKRKPAPILPEITPSKNDDDLKIIVGKNVITIDRFDLKKISPVFSEMIESGKVPENKIKITEFSFEIVKTVLDFYKGIEILPESFLKSDDDLQDFLEFNNNYQMEDFEKYLCEKVKITKNNISKISKIALKFRCETLRKLCFHFLLQTSIRAKALEKFDYEMKEKIHQLINVKEGATFMFENDRFDVDEDRLTFEDDWMDF